jgi:hypothetical protein
MAIALSALRISEVFFIYRIIIRYPVMMRRIQSGDHCIIESSAPNFLSDQEKQHSCDAIPNWHDSFGEGWASARLVSEIGAPEGVSGEAPLNPLKGTCMLILKNNTVTNP